MDDTRKTHIGSPSGSDIRRREAVSQAEIDDVLTDDRLSLAERMARLGDLRQRLLDDEHADGDEVFAPLRLQVMDALSMLAEGGHDYDGSLHVEGEKDSDGDEPGGGSR